MKEIKKNNQGLSLIEVLVAVMILAIVVTPFLHSFITTANTNSKAKIVHKATVLAQSVMEGFKAEDLENVCLQFDYPDRGFRIVDSKRIGDGGNVASHVEELYYDSAAGSFSRASKYEDLTSVEEENRRDQITASIYSEDLGENVEFLGQESGIYYFALEGVKEDASTYDVLVKLDATVYRAGGTNTVVDASHRYNSDSLAQLPIVDLKRDAVCIQKDSYTENAISQFTEPTGANRNNVIQNMTRRITVTIERMDLGGDTTNTKVTTEYRYAYKPNDVDPEEVYVKTLTSFDSTETGQDLRSVYLYYYPLYSASVARDEIVVNNSDSVPVNLFLMKQVAAGASTTDEERYQVRLSIQEGNTGTDIAKADMKTSVQTNFGINIVDDHSLGTPGYQIFLNGNMKNPEDIRWNTVLTSDTADRVFDLEVSVYTKGAKALGYPEDSRLATLTGSRLK